MQKQTTVYIVYEYWRPMRRYSKVDDYYRTSVDCVFAEKRMAEDHAKLMEEQSKEVDIDTYYEVHEVMYVGN